MKSEQELFQEYLKFNPRRPLFFGKQEHWENFLDGYECGYEDAVEECHENWGKELGMDVENFPVDIDEQFEVVREALQQYYKSKKYS